MTWTPTAENINALPKPVREYIMRLSTDEKRAGLIAKVQIMEGQVKALNKMLEEAPEVEMWVDKETSSFSVTDLFTDDPSALRLLSGKRVKLVEVG